jgi:hypothetical protein
VRSRRGKIAGVDGVAAQGGQTAAVPRVQGDAAQLCSRGGSEAWADVLAGRVTAATAPQRRTEGKRPREGSGCGWPERGVSTPRCGQLRPSQRGTRPAARRATRQARRSAPRAVTTHREDNGRRRCTCTTFKATI